MNNNTSGSGSGWLFGTNKIGGWAYGVGVSIGILLLITTITLASYYCTRNHISASPTTTPRRRRRAIGASPPEQPMVEPQDHISLDVGLDEETIKSYPKVPYEEARVSYSKKRDATTTSCCSICLADYKGSDLVRVLPECDHLFHSKCVDPWLRLHATCPLCRTSPLPTPVTTPLAGAAPPSDHPPG